MAASIAWLDTDEDAPSGDVIQTPAVGDRVKHFRSNRVGQVRYVGRVRMVIYFEDEDDEEWRWITAFLPY